MAAAEPQPITFAPSDHNDLLMSTGSFMGPNGSFNSASLTRRFLGSPISFRAGSFGSRFYPGVSPGQLVGPLDPNDFRFGKISSSIESDRGSSSLANALHVFERQDELCRDYQCCGVNLNDMHALVDHFEECHVVVVDPFAPQPSYQNVASAPAIPPQASYYPDSQTAPVVATYTQGSFDPDDMELDVDHTSAPSSKSSSPPDTPISTPLSSYPGANAQSASQMVLPRAAPISAFDTTTVLPSRSGNSALSAGFPLARPSASAAAPRAEDAFNAYAGYSDYSSLMPGTVNTSPQQPVIDEQGNFSGSSYGSRAGCVPPALLLNSTATTPDGTPDSSRVASPVSGVNAYPPQASIQPIASGSGQSSASQTPRASTTLSRPASSLLLSKPFKCPKPNCNKSYKQANGLKYHMTHGSCNFAPPKDLEHLQALLASKRSQKGDTGEEISDAELREVEKEAERQLRPYACGVGDCQRRYKNMNGLRYHYQHSGDHGAIGLALLASGQHECLQHTRSHSRHVTPGHSNTTSQRSSPNNTPAPARAQPANNYVPVAAAPPAYTQQQTYQLQPQLLSQGQQQSPQYPGQAVPIQMQYTMQLQR